MTYDDIMNIEDIQEKEDKLKEFYLNEIEVEKWLIDDTKTQTVRFADRWEYKLNGELHNLNGPAINFHNKGRGFYYIYGESLNEIEWKKKAQAILREKKLRRTLGKTD